MMFQVNFDPEMLRQIIREELTAILEGQANPYYDLPPLLTRNELKQLLRIGDTKAAELLGREDFPVFREAGVLIPTDLLFQWIVQHTTWIDHNSPNAPLVYKLMRQVPT